LITRYIPCIYVFFILQVQSCRRFQTTLFRILLNRDVTKLTSVSDDFSLGDNPEIDFLLLPATVKHQRPSNSIIDWKPVLSVPFSSESTCDCKDHACNVRIRNDSVCSCKLENCVVYTPHNGSIYIIYTTDGTKKLNGNSTLNQGLKGITTYKEHFKKRWVNFCSLFIYLCLRCQPLITINNFDYCFKISATGLNWVLNINPYFMEGIFSKWRITFWRPDKRRRKVLSFNNSLLDHLYSSS